VQDIQVDWELLSSERKAYGVSEIARSLGEKPATVRQWLYRQKQHIWWGFPTYFPAPAERVGGRPVWFADQISWWLGLRVLEIFPRLRDDQLYDKGVSAADFHPDDPRYVDGQILKADSPMLGGRNAFRLARERGVPPLSLAIAINCAESEWLGMSEAQWRSSIELLCNQYPGSREFFMSSIDLILQKHPDLWAY
jgi:hypothetical protein